MDSRVIRIPVICLLMGVATLSITLRLNDTYDHRRNNQVNRKTNLRRILETTSPPKISTTGGSSGGSGSGGSSGGNNGSSGGSSGGGNGSSGGNGGSSGGGGGSSNGWYSNGGNHGNNGGGSSSGGNEYCTGYWWWKNCESGGSNGSYNAESYNGGSYNGGSYNVGSNNAGSYNAGSYNGGSYNGGSYNGGSYNGGSYNGGSYNGGSYNGGSYNGGRTWDDDKYYGGGGDGSEYWNGYNNGNGSESNSGNGHDGYYWNGQGSNVNGGSWTGGSGNSGGGGGNTTNIVSHNRPWWPYALGGAIITIVGTVAIAMKRRREKLNKEKQEDESIFSNYEQMSNKEAFQTLYNTNTSNAIAIRQSTSRYGVDENALLPISSSLLTDTHRPSRNDPLLHATVPPYKPPTEVSKDEYSSESGSEFDPFGSQGTVSTAASFDPPTMTEYAFSPLAKSSTFDPLARENYYHQSTSTSKNARLEITQCEDAFDPPKHEIVFEASTKIDTNDNSGDQNDINHEDPPLNSRSFVLYGNVMIANSSSTTTSQESEQQNDSLMEDDGDDSIHAVAIARSEDVYVNLGTLLESEEEQSEDRRTAKIHYIDVS